ncbi:GPI ethanolamine phosphate transferase 3 subunit O [Nematocida sp. AWRm77]|nr:GPI ethanolamine phosphate transferase 3 subunit O [Nematocida sp. AWRm77]
MFNLQTWKNSFQRKEELRKDSIQSLRLKGIFSICACLFFIAGVCVYFRSLFVERTPLCDTNKEAGAPICAKMLVLVADGVRPDAVFPAIEGPAQYHGNLPFLESLEKTNTGRTYAAIADLPTGTAMRVYSIFSGVPTTLLSAQRSFIAGACMGDHFVSQVLSSGKSAAFFGDSTWAQLFPQVETLPGKKSSPYGLVSAEDEESLTRGALHALKEKDVVIVHLISPDSCGHVFGVDSKQVKETLQRINSFLEEAQKELQAQHANAGTQSAIVVLSDHGVNDDGSHGGASVKERSAIFCVTFPHAKTLSDARAEENTEDVRGAHLAGESVRAEDIQGAFNLDPLRFSSRNVVSQNDILPTLCTLLGIPTPLNSSGSPIPELLPASHAEKIKMLLQESARKRKVLHKYGKHTEHADSSSNAKSPISSLYKEDLLLGRLVHGLFHSHSMLGMALGILLVSAGVLCLLCTARLSVLCPFFAVSVGLIFLVAHSMYAVIHEDVISAAGALAGLFLCFGAPRRPAEMACAAMLLFALCVGRFPLHEMDRFRWIAWMPKLPALPEAGLFGRVCMCGGAISAWSGRSWWALAFLCLGRSLCGHPSRALLLSVPALPASLLLLWYSAGTVLFLLGGFCPLVRALAKEKAAKDKQSVGNMHSACALFFLLKLSFFATGHNHNLSTINWEAAFALSKQPILGVSPALVLSDLLFPLVFAAWTLGAQNTDILGGVLALQGICVVLGCAVNFWFLGHSLLWFVFSGRTIFESIFLLVLAVFYTGACAQKYVQHLYI